MQPVIPVSMTIHPESKADTLFNQPLTKVSEFDFDSQVAEVFPDMIQRSVPGYDVILSTLSQLTSQFSQAQSHYYDLGCSLGAATLMMRKAICKPGCRLFAIDNSKAMLERCQTHVQAYNYATPVSYLLQDINEVPIENATIVVLNFTLQFIPLNKRQQLINRIYQGLRPGGLLFLSEKLYFGDSVIDDLFINLHHEFKKANGYSELEIAQKRASLENVLVPETYSVHAKRLQEAGFEHHSLWYQNMNFSSMVAIKG